jgi:hypothetical protein
MIAGGVIALCRALFAAAVIATRAPSWHTARAMRLLPAPAIRR